MKISNARISSADGNMIDVDVDGRPMTLAAADTVTKGLFARAKAGEFGVVAAYVAPPPSLGPSLEDEARRIVSAAFGGPMRRMSVQSYFARIAAKAPAQRTDEEKADLATLQATDLWEEAMLDYARGPALTASPLAWPPQPDGLADLVAAC